MEQARIASAARKLRHVFLRDMVLPARIGVHAHEHGVQQRVRVNVDLGVADHGAEGISMASAGCDILAGVVDYETVANAVRGILLNGHILLVETLAERIAEVCMADLRVELVRVRVEKLDVFPDMAAAGVEIERRRSDLSTRGVG
jgi:7,8-dihydroneopterin aldolase/epimerase/oxygenase